MDNSNMNIKKYIKYIETELIEINYLILNQIITEKGQTRYNMLKEFLEGQATEFLTITRLNRYRVMLQNLDKLYSVLYNQDKDK